MPFRVGETVGPYRILEQLGQGGMATVFKAYHAALDRYVAIKVLHPAFQEDKNFHARFQREARVVASLEHPNIVPVYDYAGEGTYPYLVMKFIEGETLKARLETGPLSDGETLGVVDAVGGALAYAHQMGVLHRDIKPSNVIIARGGRIYLADFGLARIAQSGTSTLTSDMIVGTPQYISPEQATGRKDLDAGTDIYSFGVMLYEIAVGRVPFNADTPYSIIHDHIYAPLPLPRDLNPMLHLDVERVLLKSLAKDRADRYMNVPDQVEAFKAAWLEGMRSAPVEPPAPDEGATLIASPASAEAALAEIDNAMDGETKIAAPGAQPDPEETKIATIAGEEPEVAPPGPPSEDATVLAVPGQPTPEGQLPPGPGIVATVPKSRSRPWVLIGGLALLLVVVAGIFLAARATGMFGVAGRAPGGTSQTASSGSDATRAASGTELDTLRAAVTENPGDPQAHLNLAKAYFRNNLLRLGLDETAAAAEAGRGDGAFLRSNGEAFRSQESWLGAAIFYTVLAEVYYPQAPEDVREPLHHTVYIASGLKDALFPTYIPFDRLLAIDKPLGQIAQVHYVITRELVPSRLPVFDELVAEHGALPDVRLLQAEVALRRGQTDRARNSLSVLFADQTIPQWVRDYATSLQATLP
jgi:serine/threonine protein kinase